MKNYKDIHITGEQLLELCKKYDKEHEKYPEHVFEGKSFFIYVVEGLFEDSECLFNDDLQREYDYLFGYNSKNFYEEII